MIMITETYFNNPVMTCPHIFVCICVSLGLYQWSESVIRMVSRLWDVRGGLMVRHQVRVLVTPRVVVSCDSN